MHSLKNTRSIGTQASLGNKANQDNNLRQATGLCPPVSRAMPSGEPEGRGDQNGQLVLVRIPDGEHRLRGARGRDKGVEVRSMRRMRSAETRVRCRLLGRGSILAVLAVATQVGCTREFFREWANMDVSETIFEKSRDPRWRIDLFSVEPPPLSRFANPYDPRGPAALPTTPPARPSRPCPSGLTTGCSFLLRGPATSISWNTGSAGRRKAEFEGGPGQPAAPGGNATPPAAPAGAAPPPASGYDNRPAGPAGATPPPSSKAHLLLPSRRHRALPRGPTSEARRREAPASDRAARPASAPDRDSNARCAAIRDGCVLPEGEPDVTDQSVINHGTSTRRSSPITLRKHNEPAARPKIPPPKSGGTLGAPSPRSKSAISIPPPRSGESISIRRPLAQSGWLPPPRPASSLRFVEPLRVKIVNDRSVSQASFQNNGAQAPPNPNQDAGNQALPPPVGNADQQVPRLQPRAPVGGEQPRPGGTDPNIQGPPILSPELLQEIGQMPAAEAQGLASILVATVPKMDEAEAVGLPRGFRAYKVGMAQAWLLALMNSRFYQFNLEQLYLTACR